MGDKISLLGSHQVRAGAAQEEVAALRQRLVAIDSDAAEWRAAAAAKDAELATLQVPRGPPPTLDHAATRPGSLLQSPPAPARQSSKFRMAVCI